MINEFNLTTTRMMTMMAIINYCHHVIINKIHTIDESVDITNIKDPLIIVRNPLKSSSTAMSYNMEFKVGSHDDKIVYYVSFSVFSETVGLKIEKIPVTIEESELKSFKDILKLNMTKLFLEMNKHEDDLKFSKYAAQVTTREILNMMAIRKITVDQFIDEVKDLDDINYSKVLYLIDDPNSWGADGIRISSKIKEHLEKDLMISHMHYWDPEILEHIPAFYIENGDLQYLEWWDPYIIHDYFKSEDIKQVVKIV